MIEFEQRIRGQIRAGKLNAALRAITRMVDSIGCEPINTGRVFGSMLLDNLCQEIGAANLSRVGGVERPSNEGQGGRVTVYIASRLHAAGGHTAALADIIRLSPPGRSIILVTGVGGPTDHASVVHRFASASDVHFEYVPRGCFAAKLDWIQRRLRAIVPTEVWLFNHHQDSVAVAAVQPRAGYRLRFYHHGDHHLCLGVHLNGAEHIDIHPMGFHCCRGDLGIQSNRYLPLVVADQGVRSSSSRFRANNTLLTCTAANFNKIEVPYFVRYASVIPALLLASGGRHLHIGQLRPATLRQIRQGLRKRGLPDSAFQYVPYVTSVWRALLEHGVDVYIASFPHGGGRTLIEAMGAGIPVAIHSHCASRLLGAFDLAYPGAMVWHIPEELFEQINTADAETLSLHGSLARARYEEFHREDVLRQALGIEAATLVAPALLDGYRADSMQSALDITCQTGLTGALRRTLCRLMRIVKLLRDNARERLNK
ncbi:MAG: hypothetical protein KF853_14120 [Rhodocyclaceae bacterium]|nr:hypothetical protein [Rhodocyclaceae bacterium]MCO5097816.1 glycosyltransferase family 4 protein [Rhodocyclaceae bacterium]